MTELRWWQGRFVRGMRRHGWVVIPCVYCGCRVELTCVEHARVGMLLHRLGCRP